LSLASHHAVREAAVRALADFGPHSAGCLLGNTRLALKLERELGELLEMERVLLFPTSWEASFATIVALIREQDHVLLDDSVDSAILHGARHATPNVRFHAHLDAAEARAALADIRSSDSSSAILVATRGLFPVDSASPDLARLQEACREYDATLLVDVAHDLGALGPDGTGVAGRQRMLGKIDLVVGSFAAVFASNGGFLATGSASVTQYVKRFGGTQPASSAMSPIQMGIVLEALRIVRSDEGDDLRRHMLDVVKNLRELLDTNGIPALGDPSPIVPILVGAEPRARMAAALLDDRGVLVDLAEYPAVPRGSARFQLHAMSSHTPHHAVRGVEIVRQALVDTDRLLQQGQP
jgi:glycine C-acetyltransferase/8-amino-7-oxononanoate synthase